MLAWTAFQLLLAATKSVQSVDSADMSDLPTFPFVKSWFPCELNTTQFNTTTNIARVSRHWMQGPPLESFVNVALPQFAECATFLAPLCYDGICDSGATIELFVKRIPGNQAAKKSIIIMDGGPGAASCDMEDLQQRTWLAFGGNMHVYIHDPRGTGRSGQLKCPSSADADLPACLALLNSRYGGAAAGFGITSAATDLAVLTKSIDEEQAWFLYGVSYGTLVATRSMHIAPAFKGYILDSVTPENWDNADTSFNDVALRYLKACEDDAFCSSQVKTPLVPQVEAIYKAYDNQNDTASQLQRCRGWLRVQMSLRKTEPTSFGLKKLFAWFIRSVSKQRLFPPLLLRLARCNDDDWAIFDGAFTTFLDSDELEDNILFPYDSRQLNQLIEASEIAEIQSYDDAVAEFEADLITLPEYDSIIPICYYHNSSFPECEGLGIPPVQPFVYDKDDFSGRFATIPRRASVLVLSGEYDPVTPDGWAQAQLDGLEGKNKAMYNLNNVGHSVVDTPCGFDIYKQYLQHDGKLKKINAECTKTIPKLSFQVSKELSQAVFGVDDIYKGIHDPPTPPTTTKQPATTSKAPATPTKAPATPATPATLASPVPTTKAPTSSTLPTTAPSTTSLGITVQPVPADP